MDTSRKILKDKEQCHFCIHYIPTYKNGIKTCKGQCEVTGTYKQRTDKCKKSFSSKGQIRFI